jgi:hypothetical protein
MTPRVKAELREELRELILRVATEETKIMDVVKNMGLTYPQTLVALRTAADLLGIDVCRN